MSSSFLIDWLYNANVQDKNSRWLTVITGSSEMLTACIFFGNKVWIILNATSDGDDTDDCKYWTHKNSPSLLHDYYRFVTVTFQEK